MKKLSLVFVLFWVACVCWSQVDLAQKVTYRHAAAPVKVILEELSKQTHVPLGAAANLDNEILIVKVQDIPLRELLDRIANAAAGEWTEEAGKSYLTRSSTKLQAEQKSELTIRLEAVQKALKEKFKLSPPMSTEDVEKALKQRAQLDKGREGGSFDRGTYDKIQEIDHMSPGFRALDRIIQRLDPRAIAGLKEGDRVVYSSNPTPKQVALPVNASSILSEIVKEWSVWSDAASRVPKDSIRPEYYGDSDAHKFDTPMSQPPAKVLMSVQCSDDGLNGSVGCSLIVADAGGKVLFTASDSISIGDPNDIERQAREAEKNNKSGKLVLSDLSKELGGFYGKMFGRQSMGSRVQLSDEWKHRIEHPEQFEPLSTSMSDILFSAADDHKVNIVATVPDIFFIGSIFLVGQPELQIQSVDGALAAMRAFRAADFVEADGWLNLNVLRPSTTRDQRANRMSVSDFLTTAEREGRVTLMNRAHYALAHKTMNMMDLGTVLSLLISPEEMRAMDGSSKQRLWLQMLGSLSQQQRQVLAAQDGRLSVANMTPEQLRIVDRLVYGAKDAYGQSSGLTVVGENGQDLEAPNMYGPEGHTLRTEPTEALPSGIPRDAYLTMTNNNHPVIYAYSSTQPGLNSAQEISSLAWNMASKERPDLFPWAAQQPTYDRFQLGTSDDYNLTLWFANGILKTNALLQDPSITTKGDPLPLDKMPEDFQKRLKAELDKQRENFKHYQPGEIGGRQKPPPPRR